MLSCLCYLVSCIQVVVFLSPKSTYKIGLSSLFRRFNSHSHLDASDLNNSYDSGWGNVAQQIETWAPMLVMIRSLVQT